MSRHIKTSVCRSKRGYIGCRPKGVFVANAVLAIGGKAEVRGKEPRNVVVV